MYCVWYYWVKMVGGVVGICCLLWCDDWIIELVIVLLYYGIRLNVVFCYCLGL